ncbi:glucosaminidase domain-containing protein [Thermosulfidibacter takaii]|uniref:glucosaminidase domain-containing protein n=1 Tax=Thermosulfidibacter takaii TaxID=412593 RepID=UPI0011876546|nr:glucosaminidase domain-containing protein [Thermosulfidibacter takaii]
MKRVVVLLTCLIFLTFAGLLFFYKCVRVEKSAYVKLRFVSPRGPGDILEQRCSSVIPIIYRKIPCLKPLPVMERKRTFINLLLPAVLVKNFEIERTREHVKELMIKAKEGTLEKVDKFWLKELIKKYKARSYEDLLVRLDIVPPGLVIAQAAIESGWGSSRFFCEANNIFGEWDFSLNSTGVKAKDSDVYLKKFDNLLEAVDSYYYNINTGWAYEEFRKARTKSKNSLVLAKYLHRYSQLGPEYVERLIKVIKSNRLDLYDSCSIDDNYIESVTKYRLECFGLRKDNSVAIP